MATRIRFTKEALLALPLPQGRERDVYLDTKCPALQLRVSAKGTKTFSVYRRLKGGPPERTTLGKFPAMTVEQARAQATGVNATIEHGGSPGAVKRALRGEPTFGQAFDEFLDKKRKRDGAPISERTKRDYRDVMRLHLGALATRKLSQIEASDVRALHERMSKSSPAQADKMQAVVSAVYNFMESVGKFSGVNPAKHVKKNPPVERDRFLLQHELPNFFRALDAAASDCMRDLFLVALLTGIRRENVSSMEWAHLDLEHAIWRLRKTKGGKPQNVTLAPEVVQLLRARRNAVTDLPFVFPGRGKTGHVVEPKGAWRRVLRLGSFYSLLDALAITGEERQTLERLATASLTKAEATLHAKAFERNIDPTDHTINDVRFHDLRRTLGSWQAIGGSSLPVIGKSLNHRTSKATEIYARLDLQAVRKSVNTAVAAMLVAGGVKESGEVVPLLMTGEAQR